MRQRSPIADGSGGLGDTGGGRRVGCRAVGEQPTTEASGVAKPQVAEAGGEFFSQRVLEVGGAVEEEEEVWYRSLGGGQEEPY